MLGIGSRLSSLEDGILTRLECIESCIINLSNVSPCSTVAATPISSSCSLGSNSPDLLDALMTSSDVDGLCELLSPAADVGLGQTQGLKPGPSGLSCPSVHSFSAGSPSVCGSSSPDFQMGLACFTQPSTSAPVQDESSSQLSQVAITPQAAHVRTRLRSDLSAFFMHIQD